MRHSTWVRMRNSELVSDIINNIADEEEARNNNQESPADEGVENLSSIKEEKIEDVEEEKRQDEADLGREEVTAEEATVEDATPDPATGGLTVCRSARIAAGINPPDRFVHTTFVEKSHWKEERCGRYMLNQLWQERAC
jgi:hypothetical protein